MAISEEERKKFCELMAKSDELGLEGVFAKEGGLSSQDMALLMWEQGYLALPTVDCLLKELDKSLKKAAEKQARNGGENPD